ncbi:MAG: rhomboid family intramembrane serine protease [Chitinophagales bacterium]
MNYSNFRFPRIDSRSAVFNLIMLNVVVFGITNLFPLQIKGLPLQDAFSLYYPASPFFMPHQFLSSLLTHADFFHLFFNMFNLYMFGSMLERVWGGQRLLFFFFVTGLGASVLYLFAQGIHIYSISGTFWPVLHNMTGPAEVVEALQSHCLGASGAVFAMLTAAALLFGETEMLIYGVFPLKLKYLAIFLIFWELKLQFSTTPGDNVAHLAHLSGALMGWALVRIWSRNRYDFY